MGGSRWSDDHYTHRVEEVAATGGPTFRHDADVRTGVARTAIHKTLDPKNFNNGIRESRDSNEHPNSTPIIVAFDVTGSMGSVPKQLQAVLPRLMGLLLRKGYIADPQILMAAIGDYNGISRDPDGHYSGPGDRAPCQIGQFESGIEMDDNLTNIFLEGNGGGQVPPQESYQLIWYFAGRKTACDAFEKRNKKGYLFTIGDERPYARVTRTEILSVFGDILQEPIIPTAQLIAEAQEKWELFHIIPRETSHGRDPSLVAAWQALIGAEHVIPVNDAATVCEVIGATIGLMEGNVDQESLTGDLRDVGTSAANADMVTKSLDGVAKTALTRRGVIGSDSTERL